MKSIFEKLCTSQEAAEALGVSVRSVKTWCGEGKLTAKKFGRDWAISVSSVRALEKKRKR